MILYPSVDKLLEKVDSRYSLIMLASKRAHELDAGEPGMLPEYKSNKNVGRALEEVVAGRLKIADDPAAVRAQKAAAKAQPTTPTN